MNVMKGKEGTDRNRYQVHQDLERKELEQDLVALNQCLQELDSNVLKSELMPIIESVHTRLGLEFQGIKHEDLKKTTEEDEDKDIQALHECVQKVKNENVRLDILLVLMSIEEPVEDSNPEIERMFQVIRENLDANLERLRICKDEAKELEQEYENLKNRVIPKNELAVSNSELRLQIASARLDGKTEEIKGLEELVDTAFCILFEYKDDIESGKWRNQKAVSLESSPDAKPFIRRMKATLDADCERLRVCEAEVKRLRRALGQEIEGKIIDSTTIRHTLDLTAQEIEILRKRVDTGYQVIIDCYEFYLKMRSK